MAVLLGVLAVPLRLLCVHSMLQSTGLGSRAVVTVPPGLLGSGGTPFPMPAPCLLTTRCTADGYGYGYGYYGRYGDRGHLIAEQEEQQQGLVQ